MSSGAAMIYGTSFAESRLVATSTRLPASMLPAGPPTSGKPIVLTTASICQDSKGERGRERPVQNRTSKQNTWMGTGLVGTRVLPL